MKENEQSENGLLENYEKIRTVGKGAYGTAFLYRKVSSDSLVVIKEISMIEATAEERQMSLNEVKVLSFLSHPNIIRYNKSFEKDGILMIEMEYADGGTLAQFLKNQTHPMSEQDILSMFGQIVSAIRYMHDRNILHRDLKTANVFLTIDKIVKVGDFGISKVMTTKSQAETVVGTPYYISPEMCEGKRYGPKSDIWALGCILYEMACLQKTFEGSNLLVLVNKIIKGQFQTPTGYSFLFQKLLCDLLKKDPEVRPSAQEIEDLLPQLMKNSPGKNFENLSVTETQQSIEGYKSKRSVLYELKNIGSSILLTPIALPPKSQILQVASSNTHCIALTKELLVFTWGEGKKGQLGHGNTASRQIPVLVDSLRGKNIKIVGAGDGFSVFVSETGMIMSCGDGSFGCLGHGDLKDLSKPKILEKLLSVDVTAVGCGSHHVAVLSKQGVVYSWGCGHDGCLGLGNENITALPSIVTIPLDFTPSAVHCGLDSTMIISVDGFLLGCGNNTNNKLGLSGFSIFSNFQTRTEKFLTPTKVKGIGARIVDVALGPTHSVFLTNDGLVMTLGSNQNGQLGRDSNNLSFSSKIVKKLENITVTMIHCGPTFSVAGSLDNLVYFWGSKYNENTTTQNTSCEKSHSNLSEFSKSILGNKAQMYTEPKEILGLYASKQQVERNQALTLTGINTFKNNLLVLVDTNAKLLEKLNNPLNTSIERDENSDNTDSVPEWIKLELAESVAPWTGYKTISTAYTSTHNNQ